MDDLAEVDFCPLALEESFGFVMCCRLVYCGYSRLAGCFRLSRIWFVLSFPAFWWLTQTYNGGQVEVGGRKREHPGK